MTRSLNWSTEETQQEWGLDYRVPEHVSRDDRICGGKAVVVGTRIPVFMLTDLYSDGDVSAEYVLEQYPRLTPESLDGALLYADIFKRQVDDDRRDSQRWPEQFT